MKMKSVLGFGFAVSTTLFGCSSSSGDGGDGGSGDGGSGDGGDTCDCSLLPDVSGTVEDGTCTCVDDQFKSDGDEVRACTSTTACEPSRAIEEEGVFFDNAQPLICLFAALRDRSPGRYRHNTDIVAGVGGVENTHDLVIHADGTVTRVSVLSFYDSDEDESVVVHSPTEQCSLKPPAYFSDCLEGLEADEFSEACIYGPVANQIYSEGGIDQWFESCENADPICE